VLQILNAVVIQVPDRQRKAIPPAGIEQMWDSLRGRGQLQPIGVYRDETDPRFARYVLIYGERRLRSVLAKLNDKVPLRFADSEMAPGQIACIIYTNLDPLLRSEMEFDENEYREPLTWQDRAEALANIVAMRQETKPSTSILEIAREVAPELNLKETRTRQILSASVLVAQHMDNPAVRAAPSLSVATEIVRRGLEAEFAAQLNRQTAVGVEPGERHASPHRFILGDCTDELPLLPSAFFDCILSDPPYGQGISDALALRTTGHRFDAGVGSDPLAVYRTILTEGFRVAKDQATLWLFCDIDHFTNIRTIASNAGWESIHTPLVWDKVQHTNSVRDKHGLMRQYELLFHATKGYRPLRSGRSDIIKVPYEPGMLKPPALLQYILDWSCLPGDTVLDPCCGQGAIFPAASACSVRAVGIDKDRGVAAVAGAAADGHWATSTVPTLSSILGGL
jgi:DNA modification methylase/ParB-like chromosome segregation protein Spo0J